MPKVLSFVHLPSPPEPVWGGGLLPSVLLSQISASRLSAATPLPEPTSLPYLKHPLLALFSLHTHTQPPPLSHPAPAAAGSRTL